MEKSRFQDLSVLIVEDEWMICILIEDMLRAMGCKVAGAASNIEDAVKQAKTLAVDAAVLDLNLDGKRSWTAADALAARRIPFVFATGYGEGALPDRFAGTPTIAKPFQRRDLEAAFERALIGARSNSAS